MSQRKRRDKESGQYRIMAEDHEQLARDFEASGNKVAAAVHRRRATHYRTAAGDE